MATKKSEVSVDVPDTPKIYVSPDMKQAIDVLIQAVEMAQKAGVYSLQDAVLIGQAANVLNPYRVQ